MKKILIVIAALFIAYIGYNGIYSKFADIKILQNMKAGQDKYFQVNHKYAATPEELGFAAPKEQGTNELMGETYYTIVPLSFKNIDFTLPHTTGRPLNQPDCEGYEICGYENPGMFSSLIKNFYYFKSIPGGYEFKIEHPCDRYSYVIKQDKDKFSAICVSPNGECPQYRQQLLSAAGF